MYIYTYIHIYIYYIIFVSPLSPQAYGRDIFAHEELARSIIYE